MIVKQPDLIKTLPEEMYIKKEQTVNEFKDVPFDVEVDGVCFPKDERYAVDFDLCKTEQEKHLEQYVAFVCQKYGLEYSQDNGVIGNPEQLNELEKALEEIGKYLPVSKRVHSLRVNGKLCYYFTYETRQDEV